jgi:hypothetical protein
MEIAVESMEKDPGAIPHPGRVPEQSLLSLELCLRWRRSCKTFRGRRLDDLGFLCRRDFICGRAMSEGGQGAHTTPWRGQRGGGTPPGGVAASWPSSVSALDSVFVSGKIRTSSFISFNSKNISCVTFLKHKNNRK